MPADPRHVHTRAKAKIHFVGPSFPPSDLTTNTYQRRDLARGEDEGVGGASQKRKNRGGLHDYKVGRGPARVYNGCGQKEEQQKNSGVGEGRACAPAAGGLVDICRSPWRRARDKSRRSSGGGEPQKTTCAQPAPSPRLPVGGGKKVLWDA